MKANAEYIRTIVEENYNNSCMDISITEYVKADLENMPESFDSFFDSSWDEIPSDEQGERVDYIQGLFNE